MYFTNAARGTRFAFMKTPTLVLSALFAVALPSAQALADGFVCGTLDRELQIQVYHSTNPEVGTRTVSAMILADPSNPRGEQTIARFNDTGENLFANGAVYTALIDSNTQTARGPSETFVGATPVSDLHAVQLTVAFNYSEPVAAGTSIPGTLTLQAVDGAQSVTEVTCIRYLKN